VIIHHILIAAYCSKSDIKVDIIQMQLHINPKNNKIHCANAKLEMIINRAESKA
jgi:hypothetical protein